MRQNDYLGPHIPRRLQRVSSQLEVERITELELATRTPPFVVLGDPGMGKTHLLEAFALATNAKFVRAGAFVCNPARFRGDNPNQTIVIDALDEVAALQDGDPLFNVLRALAHVHYPKFVLSCRAADWRGAAARSQIGDHYLAEVEQWTLEPIDLDEATAFLEGCNIAAATAQEAIADLDRQNLSQLYGNPLTLSLVARLVRAGSLPRTKHELFSKAADLLRVEHSRQHFGSALGKLSKERALDAAGQLFAAMILTGKDAISPISMPEGDYSFVSVPDIVKIESSSDSEVRRTRAERQRATHRWAYVLPLHCSRRS